MSLTYKISREKLVLRAHAHRHGCRNAFFVGGEGGGGVGEKHCISIVENQFLYKVYMYSSPFGWGGGGGMALWPHLFLHLRLS